MKKKRVEFLRSGFPTTVNTWSLELTSTAPQSRLVDILDRNASLGKESFPSSSDTGSLGAHCIFKYFSGEVLAGFTYKQIHFQEHVIFWKCLYVGEEQVRKRDDLKFPEHLGMVIFA